MIRPGAARRDGSRREEERVGRVTKLAARCAVVVCHEGTPVGCGFFVADGKVLTCAHVVAGREHVTVRWNGADHPVVARDVRPAKGDRSAHPLPDLALLTVDLAKEHDHVVMGGGRPGGGSEVTCVGHSRRNPTREFATRETYLWVGGSADDDRLTDLKGNEVSESMSGSLVLDHRTMTVCGVLKASWDTRADRGGWMVPADVVRAEFPDLFASGDQAGRRGEWHRMVTETMARPSRLPDPLDRAAVNLGRLINEQFEEDFNHRLMREFDQIDPLPMRLAPLAPIGNSPRGADGAEMVFAGKAEAASAFERIDSRRLVLLGPSGSGKTIATLLLTRELLARALSVEDERPSAPIPVLIPLAGWRPGPGVRRYSGDTFMKWLTRWFALAYPDLAKARDRERIVEELLETGRILPILDGLDEIGVPRDPAATFVLQCEALRQITETADRFWNGEGPYGPAGMILTSRTGEFTRAVEGRIPPGVAPESCDVAIPRPPKDARILEVAPLKMDDALDYLSHGSPIPRETWCGVLQDDQSAPLREGFTTPLIVSLLREFYSKAGRNPQELLKFHAVEELRKHLLRELVDKSFPSRLEKKNDRWEQDDAKRWLRFLARGMEKHHEGHIQWWALPVPKIHDRIERVLAGIAGFLLAGLAVGLGTWVVLRAADQPSMNHAAVPAALASGAVIGLLMGLCSALSKPPPANVSTGSPRPRRVLWAAVPLAMVGGAAGWVGLGSSIGRIGGALVCAALAIPVAWGYALVTSDATLQVASPRLMFRSDVKVALIFGALYGVPIGLAGLAVSGAPAIGLACAVVVALDGGLTYGLQWILALRASKAGVIALVHLFLTRLVVGDDLPWKLITFLEDAHHRGILIQVGPSYSFRHPSLRELLAEKPARRA
ncbi:MAG: trypsin-like peptidase domain-containing protein [Spirillospora sp.]